MLGSCPSGGTSCHTGVGAKPKLPPGGGGGAGAGVLGTLMPRSDHERIDAPRIDESCDVSRDTLFAGGAAEGRAAALLGAAGAAEGRGAALLGAAGAAEGRGGALLGAAGAAEGRAGALLGAAEG